MDRRSGAVEIAYTPPHVTAALVRYCFKEQT